MERGKSCLICSAHQAWTNSSWWVTLSLMGARIWIRPVLVFWGAILLYKKEKSWLLIKIHWRCLTHIQLPLTRLFAQSFVATETQQFLGCYSTLTLDCSCCRTAAMLSLPSVLILRGKSVRQRGIGSGLSSKLYRLKREREIKAQSQIRRNVANSCQNNNHMPLPRHVKANLQEFT